MERVEVKRPVDHLNTPGVTATEIIAWIRGLWAGERGRSMAGRKKRRVEASMGPAEIS
jgi:hypothetical protein